MVLKNNRYTLRLENKNSVYSVAIHSLNWPPSRSFYILWLLTVSRIYIYKKLNPLHAIHKKKNK